eukprot:3211-Pyramimonas_sp.AAC.1
MQPETSDSGIWKLPHKPHRGNSGSREAPSNAFFLSLCERYPRAQSYPAAYADWSYTRPAQKSAVGHL